MRIPLRFRVGVSTHTGLVRGANEDDYVLLAPEGPARPDGRRFLLLAAIADGMGGVAGGSEASRAALRGLAGSLLSNEHAAPRDALLGAFAAAHARVDEQASLVPALADMGTTTTALWFERDRVHLGHVGDTRAYRLRDGELRALTVDHVADGHRHRLLRCIGGGVPASPPDVEDHDLRPGDRYLLCSDGLWGVVPEEQIADLLQPVWSAAAAAEELVAEALKAGGPDNATAVVVDVTDGGDGTAEVALPREEASRRQGLERIPVAAPPRWPLPVLLAAVLLIAVALLRLLFDIDVLAQLRGAF